MRILRTTDGGLKDNGVAVTGALAAPTPAAFFADTRMTYRVLATNGARTTEREMDTPSLYTSHVTPLSTEVSMT